MIICKRCRTLSKWQADKICTACKDTREWPVDMLPTLDRARGKFLDLIAQSLGYQSSPQGQGSP